MAATSPAISSKGREQRHARSIWMMENLAKRICNNVASRHDAERRENCGNSAPLLVIYKMAAGCHSRMFTFGHVDGGQRHHRKIEFNIPIEYSRI